VRISLRTALNLVEFSPTLLPEEGSRPCPRNAALRISSIKKVRCRKSKERIIPNVIIPQSENYRRGEFYVYWTAHHCDS